MNLDSMLSKQLREGLVRLGRRRLGDRSGAEDVAQEALRRVLEAAAAGRVRDPAALTAYAHQTARHVIQQHYRDRQREVRAFGRLCGEDEADSTANPMNELIARQQRDDVRRALARLESDERALLAALYQQEVESHQAADVLGVRAATLRVRKHRALQKLGALLTV
jgi:RNA polymerase sigma factor (sigma-70 family)